MYAPLPIVLCLVVLAALAEARLIDLNSDGLARRSYDYVIVGGGTAGMVLSNRLSADPSVRVAVLEAGPSGIGNDNISCPGLIGFALGSDINWGFSTVPQTFASGQTVGVPRGRVLGGSSAINGRVFTRGSKMEYDAFEALGNPGWNWASLDAAVKKAENLRLPSRELVQLYNYTFTASSYGHGGPIDATFSPWWSIPFEDGFFQSAQRLGHQVISDSNGGNKTGLSYIPSFVNQNGRRVTAFTAFYDPTRPNLDIYTSARVAHLTFSNRSVPLTATGVVFLLPNGTRASLEVTREVVLSAGVIQTPQVLELSGIGDPAVLSDAGVPVHYENPGVGTNLQDHPLVNTVWTLKSQFFNQSYDDPEEVPADFNAALALWQNNGTGILASGTPQLAYMSLHDLVGDTGVAEAKKLLATKPAWLAQKQFDILKSYIFSNNPVVEYCPIPANGENAPTLGVGYGLFQNAVQHSLSRGTVHVTTSDPTVAPAIDPRYLEAEFDEWLLAKALMHMRNITSQSTFTKAGFDQEILPGTEVQTLDEFKAHAKKHVDSELHPIGTASMLPEKDGGVVDSHARVYGTTNVRVADASVIPLHISAHTTNIVYAFALRIAELMTSAHR